MALRHNDTYYYDIVRKNIKKFRKEKGFTQEELAEKCEMSRDYLAEIESEKRKKTFSLAILGRIADTLEVDISKMFKKLEEWPLVFWYVINVTYIAQIYFILIIITN